MLLYTWPRLLAIFHSCHRIYLFIQSQCAGLFGAHDALCITEEFKSHAVCNQWTVIPSSTQRRGLEVSWFKLSRSRTHRPALSSLALSFQLRQCLWTESIIHVLRRGQVLIEIPVFSTGMKHGSPAPTVLYWPCHLERPIEGLFTFLGNRTVWSERKRVMYNREDE